MESFITTVDDLKEHNENESYYKSHTEQIDEDDVDDGDEDYVARGELEYEANRLSYPIELFNDIRMYAKEV